MFRSLFIISISFLFISCSGKKETVKTIQKSSNRRMVLVIGNIALPDNGGSEEELRNYFGGLIIQGLEASYGGQPKIIQFTDDNLIQSPENLYRIASNDTDDLYYAKIKFNGSFDPKLSAQPVNIPTSKDPASFVEENKVDVGIDVYNGGNLKTVTRLNVSVRTRDKSAFDKRFIAAFKKAALEGYPNPSLYPKSDPRYFANLLYVYSKKKELDSTEALNCKNAEGLLSFYAKAAELFEKSKTSVSQNFESRNQKAQELENRISDSQEKAKVAEICQGDLTKTFGVEVDYGRLDPAFKPFIEEAFKTAQVEPALKQYTDRPVKLIYSINESNGIDLYIQLRFDQEQYQAWTRGRIPHNYSGYTVLSLDPYYALMQKFVVMKDSISIKAPRQLQNNFRTMRMTLGLSTLLSGEIRIGLGGTFDPKRKSVAMAYPNTLMLQIPGFDSKRVSTKNSDIFNEKGWIALGSCKTIDGTMTEDGLVYRFFGLPCS